MVGWCYVPLCTTGTRKDRRKDAKHKRKLPSMFRPPRDETLRLQWERNCHRKDRRLTDKDFICARHFRPEDIISEWRTVLPNGEVNIIKKARPSLRPNAIPTIFPERPKNFVKSNYSRKILREHTPPPSPTSISQEQNTESADILTELLTRQSAAQAVVEPAVEANESGAYPVKLNVQSTNKSDSIANTLKQANNSGSTSVLNSVLNITLPKIWNILKEAYSVELPSLNWGIHIFPKQKVVTFAFIDSKYVVRKAVKISNDLKPKVYINGSKEESIISTVPLECNEDIEQFLRRIDDLIICNGTGLTSPMYSPLCNRILEAEGSCDACIYEKRSRKGIEEWETMEKQRQYIRNLKIHSAKQKAKRLEDRANALKSQLRLMINKCRVVGLDHLIQDSLNISKLV